MQEVTNKNFEQSYFDRVYQKGYEKRNPDYKLHTYLKIILQFQKGGKLLDAGCAYGSFLALASSHFSCTGIDISQYALDIARKRLPKNTMLSNQMVEEMELPQRFEVITAFDVLEHVNDLEQALGRIKRHLKPKGLLVLVVPVYDGFFGRVVYFLDKDATHIHKRGRSFWLRRVSEQGFKIELVSGIFRYLLFGIVYINWISHITKKFSPAILIIARK